MRDRIFEFFRLYAIYNIAIVLAGLTTFIVFALLVRFTPVGFIVFMFLREVTRTEDVAPLILVSSLPAVSVFYFFLKRTALRISLKATFLCYAAGNATAILLLPLIATPSVTRLDGFLIFLGLACTVGYAFVYWRRVPNQPHSPIVDT
ncbi:MULTISPECIES: hypothetical protein [unclassified Pseudovibrio]|uniref:hypothetical protein n=1 Tax=unclassified Pseudovibrio TaxID=2627060 RepID=UPI000681EEDF|nr:MULTISPECIES: hypothetical protein [unclassified Pseudovibrio]